MIDPTEDRATLAALGTARMALFSLQFVKGPLASHLPEITQAIMAADEREWNQSHQSIAANVRRASAFEGSLTEAIGFIDRPDDEIRSFLTALAASLENETALAESAA